MFHEGKQVLLLLPTSNNKLLLHRKAPYRVLEKKEVMDYCTDVDRERTVFHANVLHTYVSRTFNVVEEVTAAVGGGGRRARFINE